MRTAIEQINKIGSQIEALKKLVLSGRHVGAGLSVDLRIGANSDYYLENIDLGVYGEPDKLLEVLLESLTNSRRRWINALRADVVAATAFLEGLK